MREVIAPYYPEFNLDEFHLIQITKAYPLAVIPYLTIVTPSGFIHETVDTHIKIHYVNLSPRSLLVKTFARYGSTPIRARDLSDVSLRDLLLQDVEIFAIIQKTPRLFGYLTQNLKYKEISHECL